MMEKGKTALAVWHLIEQLSEGGIIDDFPIHYYRPDEIRLEQGVVFPCGIRVALSAMERSIYMLFLRHPEGIRMDMRWQYYSELLEIYLKESSSSDLDWKEKRIDELCEDDSSRFSSHISHIRRKLQRVLPPVDAERFCIKKHAGGIYRIGALRR